MNLQVPIYCMNSLAQLIEKLVAFSYNSSHYGSNQPWSSLVAKQHISLKRLSTGFLVVVPAAHYCRYGRERKT